MSNTETIKKLQLLGNKVQQRINNSKSLVISEQDPEDTAPASAREMLELISVLLELLATKE